MGEDHQPGGGRHRVGAHTQLLDPEREHRPRSHHRGLIDQDEAQHSRDRGLPDETEHSRGWAGWCNRRIRLGALFEDPGAGNCHQQGDRTDSDEEGADADEIGEDPAQERSAEDPGRSRRLKNGQGVAESGCRSEAREKPDRGWEDAADRAL